MHDWLVIGLIATIEIDDRGHWRLSPQGLLILHSVSIFTMGLSTKFHFLKDTKLSPYVGGMIGYRFININTYGDLPNIGIANLSLGELAYQVYIGASWYFVKWMGLDARAGYGNNYYAQIGLSFRFQLIRDNE